MHGLFALVHPHLAAVSDAELLTRFRDERDELSFAEVVRRYGPMVWGVCRRGLSQLVDVEDAFQAAFLVLVRRAEDSSGKPIENAIVIFGDEPYFSNTPCKLPTDAAGKFVSLPLNRKPITITAAMAPHRRSGSPDRRRPGLLAA